MDLEFKKDLLSKLCEQLKSDLAVLTKSALAAREAATHEESKAEGKYDTRGLEASYLAGAQAKRAAEIQDLIRYFSYLELHNFNNDTPIAATALIEVEINEERKLLFIAPKGGGSTAVVGQHKVQVVTPFSALGEELMGRTVDEEFEYFSGRERKECRVLSIH